MTMAKPRDPCEYVGVTGAQCERLQRLLETAQPKARKKRAPSFYNLYTKACLVAKGGVKTFGKAGPLMKECAGEYREDKKTGKYRYEVEVPPQASNPTPNLYKGRDLQKEWKDLFGKVSGRR